MENFAKVHQQVVQYNRILPLLVGSQKMLSTMHHVLNSLLVYCLFKQARAVRVSELTLGTIVFLKRIAL